MRLLLFSVCFGNVLFASNVNIAETDFIVRVINFVLFVAILWYFVAGHLKAFLQRRKDNIASQLEEIQNRLKNAKKANQQAHKQLEETKKRAVEMLDNAKEEALLIAKKYEAQYKSDLENIKHHLESLMDFEQRKMELAAIESILKELFKGDAGGMDEKDYINILNRRVV